MSQTSRQPLDLPDAHVELDPHFLERADADRLFEELERATPWSRTSIRMFGRDIPSPRLVSWHGDPHASYRYSGVTLRPRPWIAPLEEIRERLADRLGVPFDGVLANLYRHGTDSMGWHADDEPELGPDPLLASVTLGAERRFCMKHRTRKESRIDLTLEHGTLLVMSGPTQRHWLHCIPKTRRAVGARINLTYRRILEHT